jgi:myo-inositol 2-dehydrogenase/D-chiro-inositol 1-dehydrogenase/scyllo-inositol 2-dehydrogenase (NAD+)
VHANTLIRHLPDGVLAALVDSMPDALRAAGEKTGVEARYGSLQEALERAAFDAVVITTPTFTHKDLAVLAARHGKHVLCEKPMALTLAECDEMIAACEQASVTLQIGFMRRFDPEFEAGWARVEAGEIGRPTLIKSLTHGPGLPPPWARDLRTSIGMLAEVNSHDWDTLRWFAGADPERVYAEVSNFKGAARGVDTPHFYDTALVQVRFGNGALGCISGVCPCEYGYDARLEIVGERGILQIGDLRGQAVVLCNNRDQGIITPIYRTWPQRFADAYLAELRHFLDCIRTGTRPRVTGADGRWAVAGVLAATKSFMEERPVAMREVLEARAVAGH